MTERPHPSQLRLSDAERDEAARLLGEHYAAGRLTREEHDERTTAAFAARTRGELPPLFADLPGGSPWNPPTAAPRATVPSAARGSWSPRRSPVPGVLKVLAVLLLVVLVLTHLPWILLGLLVFFVLSRSVGRRRTGCRPRARAAYR